MDGKRISVKIHEHTAVSHQSKTRLFLAVALTLFTLLVELWGGLWTNSVALLSDAGHMFMDLTALLFSLCAINLAEWPATNRRTFGLHRLEVFAAFLNGALVTAVAVWIVVHALGRLKFALPIKTGPMLAIAALGLVVNLVVAWQLHGFARTDVNIRGVFVHVMGDALASLGVVIGALLIKLTGFLVIDPIVGLFVAGIIVVNALRLLKDSVDILLEGVPKHISLEEVVRAVLAVPGVGQVDDTHVWNICSHICSLSTHVVIQEEKMGDQQKVLENIHDILWERFKIAHSTIQIHSSGWEPSQGHQSL